MKHSMQQTATSLHQLQEVLTQAGLLLEVIDARGLASLPSTLASPNVTLVTDDSRRLGPGAVFVAIAGSRQDGHSFVAAAATAGVVAVVCERHVDVAEGAAGVPSVPQLIVRSTRQALGELLGVMYRAPAEAMDLVGITGTNGKTTTTYLVESILRAAGHNPGVIGTVNYRWNGAIQDAPYTTPTPEVLHQTLASMHADGCGHAVMEVSSAALAMERLAGVRFAVAAFSNLTQDHLDVHGTMEAYRDAKALLFAQHTAVGGVAVINVDDSYGEAMVRAASSGSGAARVLRVSCQDLAADIAVLAFTSTIAGITATLRTPRGVVEVKSAPLLGRYNLANIALAVGIAEGLGIPLDAIARGVAALPGVPGRVERVPNDAGLDILVDYAHTPDALENVLTTLRPLASRRLLCVFGCGGDRDPTKRPNMGAVVARHADLAYVTSDNPRTEAPWAIIDMVLGGIPSPHRVVADRAAAIAMAVADATPGDIVLIAGKGHEDYQIVGTTKIHFDDREHAAAAIAYRAVFTAAEIARVTRGHVSSGLGDATFARLHIDGRTCAAGDLYVAVRGEIHDGHAFCAQALEHGASGVLIEAGAPMTAATPPAATPLPARIEVADTRIGLGLVAAAHIAAWRGAETAAIAPYPAHAAAARRVLAITGSAGKTTTKDLVASALAGAGSGAVHAAAGSLNNETGVPLTMLGLRAFHRFAVLEMGMRGTGQIDYLAGLARPDVAVVTNAGTAHMELLGSEDAILRAKCEIFGHLGANGVAVYPADDARFPPAVRAVAPAARVLTFGEAATADVRLVAVTSKGGLGNELDLEVQGSRHRALLRLVGRHNAINACAAVAAAVAAGVPAALAVAGLAHARAPHMRGELAVIQGRNVLIDCYNANPASMAAALHTLAELAGGAPAVAVLGDMRELGALAHPAHVEVGALAAKLGIGVVAMGEHAGDVVEGWRGAGAGASSSAASGEAATTPAHAEAATTPAHAAARALALTAPNQWILVKASRGMKLERVVEAMQQR